MWGKLVWCFEPGLKSISCHTSMKIKIQGLCNTSKKITTRLVLEIVRVGSKSSVMNVQEKFNIYKETEMNNQINDKSTTGHKFSK